MGITPISKSSPNVFCAFRYCVLCCGMSKRTQKWTDTHIGNVVSSEKYLGNGLPQLAEQSVPHTHKLALSYRSKCLPTGSIRKQDVLINTQTCTWGRCFGLFLRSIFPKATPMAPEDTMTTRLPFFRSLTAVSTIMLRLESRGSWLSSSTIELVPRSQVRRVLGRAVSQVTYPTL